jgi:hypothetical protein
MKEILAIPADFSGEMETEYSPIAGNFAAAAVTTGSGSGRYDEFASSVTAR